MLDVAGVGYDVLLPAFLRESAGEEGDALTLEIHYHVSERQPRPVLIGFREPAERAFFEEFISVSGIGPVTAARALTMPIGAVAAAIEAGDAATLRRLEGVGPRTAEKIVAALRGKVAVYATDLPGGEPPAPRRPSGPSAVEREALEVLEQLGYRRAEAMRMVQEAADARGEAGFASAEALIQAVFARHGER